MITELWWYMTSDEYDAFAAHNNTRTDPYYSDSETGRGVELAIAMVLFLLDKRYGTRRARMEYINEITVIDSIH